MNERKRYHLYNFTDEQINKLVSQGIYIENYSQATEPKRLGWRVFKSNNLKEIELFLLKNQNEDLSYYIWDSIDEVWLV